MKKFVLSTLLITVSLLSQPKDMSSEEIITLYQMMKDTHEILTQNNIPYWATAGTLLGVVRHKGIIPWDNDIDLGIPDSHEQDFFSLRTEFNKYGYDIYACKYPAKIRTGEYKIYKIDENKPTTKYTSPFIDVFTMYNRNNTYIYNHSWFGSRNGKPAYFTPEELFPLKEYPFGETVILAANNPYPFLDANFGKDWNSIAKKYRGDYHHHKVNPTPLTENDRQPAQPTGPLKDNIS